MFTIAHNEASGRLRYVRDDSSPRTLWSTADPARAIAFDSADDAGVWAFSLAEAMTDRLLSRRAFVQDTESGERCYLEDPVVPAWLDDESLTIPLALVEAAATEMRAEVPPIVAKKSRNPESPSLIPGEAK